MASSRDTRNGPDWQDVAAAMENYKLFTGVEFVVELTSAAGAQSAGLFVTAHAYEKGKRALGARPLASASVSCRQAMFVSLEAVVMKALFDLDVALYQVNGVL